MQNQLILSAEGKKSASNSTLFENDGTCIRENAQKNVQITA